MKKLLLVALLCASNAYATIPSLHCDETLNRDKMSQVQIMILAVSSKPGEFNYQGVVHKSTADKLATFEELKKIYPELVQLLNIHLCVE